MAEGGLIGVLALRLRAGDRLVAAWCTAGDPSLAEALIRAGYDTAVLDMQHGAFTVETAIRGIAQVALAGAPAIVRVPVGDFATASRMLDAGAAGVIAPMINSVADAETFVSFAKYPPAGGRSWGPHRAVPMTGLDPAGYFKAANAIHLAIPMIETRAALDALDGILAVPGVDGVFVGPADLSVALSNGGGVDPTSREVDAALRHIVTRAEAAGKFASLFCADGALAKAMLARGFRLCSASTDLMLLRQAAGQELGAAR
ncbi:HpcH/HpaI aldolase family protein [Lichenihabitans psoromatis]|uniref:HpcH/HpaI aldolase family protein n=1 Tax=Lichenihabitans psoromatis TaxID=2528642 RepID=UPI0010385345|nr:aldolase/citrate lyase family protein [Lichenihabitans psoromatis]